MDEKQKFLNNFADMLCMGNKLLLEEDDDILFNIFFQEEIFNNISSNIKITNTSNINS